jgi:hypothetical protein
MTRDYAVAAALGLGVYSASNLTSRIVPGNARQIVLAPLIFAYTLLAFLLSRDGSSGIPEASLTGWQMAMRFLNGNIWFVLTIASGFYVGHVLAMRVWGRWCEHALKTPCTAAGMMAQEICPNAQGPGFVGCVQEEAVAVTKAATADLRFVQDLVLDSFSGIGDALNAGRELFAQIRKGVETVVDNMYHQVIGSLTPVVQAGLSVRAMMGQMQAVLATMAYLLLAGLMGAKSFIGGFIQVGNTTVGILSATLAIMIAVMFFSPWMAIPAAVIAGVLAAVAIPLRMVTDMAHGLGISW